MNELPLTNMSTAEYRQGNGFIAEVVRTSRRKTARIKIEDSVVSIVVPEDLSVDRIDELLAKKHRWIAEKMSKQQAAQPARTKEFISGEAFSYLGRNYRLKVKKGPFTPVKLINGHLVATLPEGAAKPHMVRNALARWYQAQALPKFEEKTKRYAKLIGVKPSATGIKNYKARWGSCNSNGAIDFNWKLIMAPHSVVDYVVVHELCHLRRFDHSKEFWNHVARYCPDYQDRKLWLKINGIFLSI